MEHFPTFFSTFLLCGGLYHTIFLCLFSMAGVSGCSGTLSDNYATYRIVLKLVETGLRKESMLSKVEAKLFTVIFAPLQ